MIKKNIVQLTPSIDGDKLSATQVAEFLEDFRHLQVEEESENKLISMRIQSSFLDDFKDKCLRSNLSSYQKQIRLLMSEWLLRDN